MTITPTSAKKVKLTYFENAEIPYEVGEFPLDEEGKNAITFSHEWWSPVEELSNFVKNVFQAMDLNYIMAISSLATDLSKYLGTSFKPLAYHAIAWKGPADPFSINLQLLFRFGQNGRYDAFSEVYRPTMDIVTRTVPVFAREENVEEQGTWVFGPGPRPLDILSTAGAEITSLQFLLPGKGELKKSISKNEKEAKAQEKLFNKYEQFVNENGDTRLTVEQLSELESMATTKETQEYYAYIIRQEGINSLHQRNQEKLQEDLEGLQNLLKAPNYQAPRTWELIFGGYKFKYLVCRTCVFTFDPEVDQHGFPIRSTVQLGFQPYLLALANTIGAPYTGEKIGNQQVDYGWSKYV